MNRSLTAGSNIFPSHNNSWKAQGLIAIFLVIFFLQACRKIETVNIPSELSTASADIAVKWADMTLYTIRYSRFNTPTYSSRSLGYMGLTMYESLVGGDPSYKSMTNQLNGLVLPQPLTGKTYHWILSLNAAQEKLLKLLYPISTNSDFPIYKRIDSLSKAIFNEESKGLQNDIINRSVRFGEYVAQSIYNWSLTDGGNKAYTRNFDPSYVFPNGESHWIPPARGQTISSLPLHPHWGGNRPFVTANKKIPIPGIIPFSTDTASRYYKIYKAVYDKDKTLTQEEMEIAAWWGDDPTETFSPPGHSYHLATIAVKKSNPGIMKAAETYARTGMSVADAFIMCWKTKTVYFNERPSTYVWKYIDNRWLQFWPEPPFPAFPSGHSMQSAAAATVLTDLFGNNFSFTDIIHAGHRRYDDNRFLNLRYPPRNFSSFWEAADECAYSRFLGGIHTQQDNEVGQELGRVVGGNVNRLRWRR